MPETSIILGATLVPARWKNGGGVTREIAAEPAGATLGHFDWRVSIADIAHAGPFSRFDGVDRVLVLLSGAGMTLRESGGTQHVFDKPLDMLSFAGETHIDATLTNGPTRDFNVMVRRGVVSAQVSAHREAVAFAVEDTMTLLYCVHGRIDVLCGDAMYTLEHGDTLRINGGASCRVTCHDAQWLHIGLKSTRHEDSPR